MKIVERKVSELIPYENNPRRNDDAVQYVVNSIREFGFKVPLVIDKDGVVVTGHTRLKAAEELGMETVPCVIADDLTPEQAKQFRLVDNKTAEMAGWDYGMLDIELDEIGDLIDMSQFGFETMEVDDMIDELFTDAEPKEKEPKQIQCPHCHMWFEA